MKRATHIGECQVCGRQQTLPNGKLSKHGYAVMDHYFVGACPGSRNLPFEQSKDLVERHIGGLTNQIDTLTARVADHTAGREPLMALRYYSAGCWIGKASAHRWERVYATDFVSYPHTVRFETPTGEPPSCFRKSLDRYRSTRWTIVHQTSYRNEQDMRAAYVKYLQRTIEELVKFRAWSQERADKWKLRELVPRK